MIYNGIRERAAAPGNGLSVLLGGADTGYLPWSFGFADGADVYYAIVGTVAGVRCREVGKGSYVASPSTVTRAGVIWNSVDGRNSPNRLAFDAQVLIYNVVPAERMVYVGADLAVRLPGKLSVLDRIEAASGGIAGDFTSATLEVSGAFTAGSAIIVGGMQAASGTFVGAVNAANVQQNGAALLPKGSCIQWAGNGIPTGYQKCDGTNGAPNMANDPLPWIMKS